MFPFIIPAVFNSFKCCETVACANGSSETISPQKHSFCFSKNSTIAKRAGCPKALAMFASEFCCSLKCADLLIPIIKSLSQYYDKDDLEIRFLEEFICVSNIHHHEMNSSWTEKNV